ncbi:MAG: protein kinase [Desulforhopalus sp.]
MDDSTSSVFLKPGTLLGSKYQIIRLIGQGGMGTVYMAYDSSLDLNVAIKVISPDALTGMDEEQREVALKRFQAEARILAKIDHPNVIRILGFNRDTTEYQDRTVDIDYLVMELLAQRTLRDTMDESGFESEDEIKEWIGQYMIPILDGVDKIHSSGIIHRDIKPENFFLKDDKAKLADFGLSLGLDQPSVTGPMVDIFGTLKYMSPEQFYNFSLAREPSDIFSLGRILYEVVEGTMTEKIKPFKQVKISRTDTPFFKTLGEVIAEATAENPKERIATARQLMERLSDILYCRVDFRERQEDNLPFVKRLNMVHALMLFLATAMLTMAYVVYIHDETVSPPQQNANPATETALAGVEVITNPQLEKVTDIFHANDNSIMTLIPGLRINLPENTDQSFDEYAVDPFYLSENPITNQQFVAFLNGVIDRLKIQDSDLMLDGKLILKLSEKIREYKPILFDGKKFVVEHPMHAACAVLMVTGYGAQAYAGHYGLRLPKAREWYALKASQPRGNAVRLALPTPVINYSKNRFDIRGINEIAEWGKNREGSFVVLGRSSSTMIESELVSVKDPDKYYTDTSFRVARDVEMDKVPKKSR